MSATELRNRSPSGRDLHFCIANEGDTLRRAPEEEVFTVAENEVIHYLLEHILRVDNPYLLQEADQIPYSYKLIENTDGSGQKTLIPANYDGQTDFITLCEGPFITLASQLQQKEKGYEPTDQEIRMLNRYQAEARGAARFQQLVFEADDDSFIIWSSPPGKKEDGYWDSSITYAAWVKAPTRPRKREILCYRCIHNLPLSKHIDFLNFFLDDHEQLTAQATAEDIVLQPIYISPAQALNEYSLNEIYDLVNRIYRLDNKSFDAQQVTRQLARIQRLRRILAPEIDQLSRSLVAGQLDEADRQLNLIEKEALENYFDVYELVRIITGRDLQDIRDSLPERELSEHSDLAAWAWRETRDRMTRVGTSCPSVRNSADVFNREPPNPHQELIDRLASLLDPATSEESGKCPNCAAIMDLSTECCRKCKHRG
jgi:hypothetical protein